MSTDKEKTLDFLFSESIDTSDLNELMRKEVQKSFKNMWNIFFYEFSAWANPELSEEETKANVWAFFWDGLKLINLDKDSRTGSDLEKNEICGIPTDKFSWMMATIIASAYTSDFIKEYQTKRDANLLLSYLSKINYYSGMAHGLYLEKITISNKNKEAKRKQFEQTKGKTNNQKSRVKAIWDAKKWKNYKECTVYIYDNDILGEKEDYRKIYDMVREVGSK